MLTRWQEKSGILSKPLAICSKIRYNKFIRKKKRDCAAGVQSLWFSEEKSRTLQSYIGFPPQSRRCFPHLIYASIEAGLAGHKRWTFPVNAVRKMIFSDEDIRKIIFYRTKDQKYERNVCRRCRSFSCSPWKHISTKHTSATKEKTITALAGKPADWEWKAAGRHERT